MNTCSCSASSAAFNTAQSLIHKTTLKTTQTNIPVAKTIPYPLKLVSTISKQTASPRMYLRLCGYSSHCPENHTILLQTPVIH